LFVRILRELGRLRRTDLDPRLFFTKEILRFRQIKTEPLADAASTPIDCMT
jgi:hypothetical protein